MQSFKISKLCLLKWWPYQYNARCEKTLVLLFFSLDSYVKLYEGIINSQYIFLKCISGSGIFSSFMISNLLILKSLVLKVFNITQNLGKKAIFFNVLTCYLMKKLPFLIQISNVHVSICYTAVLQDLEISATKMTVFSYKIRNENLFYNCFIEAFFKTFEIKLFSLIQDSEIRFRI